MKIGKKIISKNSEPFIIAEAGINHNGDLALAKKMVMAAKDAGCDAVKFQTFKATEFCGDPEQIFTYQSQGKEVSESMLRMFERHEFSVQEWKELKDYCDKQDICFLSTPQNSSDLDLLLKLNIDAIKVGSDDFTNLPLLKEYYSKGKPLILSCGMSDLAEVYQSLNALNILHHSRPDIVLCLCTSQYPTPPEDINLRKLSTLENVFPNVIKGFSDHSQGPIASTLAVSFGAVVFEKHFTLNNDFAGPDHWFSENPETLKVWAQSIRSAYLMLGSSVVSPTQAELEMRTLARRSVVALKDIEPNEQLNQTNIGLRRPGNGLPPSYYEDIINCYAQKKVKKGQLLKLGDFYS